MSTNENTHEDESSTVDFKPLEGHEVVASFHTRPSGTVLERLETAADGARVVMLEGESGLTALEPDGLWERLRSTLDELRRPRSVLADWLRDGGVVVRTEYTDETLGQITDALVHAGAGWIYKFDDLTWSELHTPASEQ